MNSFGEPLRFNKIEKTEKRKKDNRLSLSVSTTIGVVLRGLQIFSTHFSSHPSDTQEFNQTKSTFSYVNLRLLQKPPRVHPNCILPPGTGRTSSLLHHLHPQQETSLVPSKRDLTCTLKKRSHLHPQKGVLWGPLKGPEIDMEKCRFSLCEVATFSCA